MVQTDGCRQLWEEAYQNFWARFNGDFKTSRTRLRAQEYVRGLMSSVDRKNSWQLAEFIGESAPYGLQNFLYRASWNVGGTRDKLILSGSQYLLTPNEKGVLIIDETGFLKKGKHSAGVKRQYSGTAGRTENSQVGVFMAIAGSIGRTLIDGELYLPKEWCDDASRRKAAGIPDEIVFQTKQQLAQKMLGRAFALGIRPEWVLADAAYGNDSKFRTFLQSYRQPYVVGISSNQTVWIGFEQLRVDEYIEMLSKEDWQSVSAGRGSKGLRLYDWLCLRIGEADESGMSKFLLARRKKLESNEEYAYYYCYASAAIDLDSLVEAAGQRWNIECCFETAKQEVGLDEYEVRSWQGWYRHITLSMVALLLLNIFRSLGASLSEEKKRKHDKVEC